MHRICSPSTSTPTTAASSPTDTSRPLSQEELTTALLTVGDLPAEADWTTATEVSVQTGSEAKSSQTEDDLFDGTCMDRFTTDETEDAVLVASTGWTSGDELATVSSKTHTYSSAGVAAEEITAALERVQGCPHIETDADDGATVSADITVQPEGDTGFTYIVDGELTPAGYALVFPMTISTTVRRDQNNLALTTTTLLGSAARRDALDLSHLSTRAAEKLTAVTAGEPVPPSAAEDELATRVLSLGQTFQSDDLRLTVSAAEPYTPSKSAYGDDLPRPVSVVVTPVEWPLDGSRWWIKPC